MEKYISELRKLKVDDLVTLSKKLQISLENYENELEKISKLEEKNIDKNIFSKNLLKIFSNNMNIDQQFGMVCMELLRRGLAPNGKQIPQKNNK